MVTPLPDRTPLAPDSTSRPRRQLASRFHRPLLSHPRPPDLLLTPKVQKVEIPVGPSTAGTSRRPRVVGAPPRSPTAAWPPAMSAGLAHPEDATGFLPFVRELTLLAISFAAVCGVEGLGCGGGLASRSAGSHHTGPGLGFPGLRLEVPVRPGLAADSSQRDAPSEVGLRLSPEVSSRVTRWRGWDLEARKHTKLCARKSASPRHKV